MLYSQTSSFIARAADCPSARPVYSKPTLRRTRPEAGGYATEAVRAFLKDCFCRFDPEEVIADHFHDNPASGRVLRKVGFEYTGRALGQSAARAMKEEVCEYSISRAALRAL